MGFHGGLDGKESVCNVGEPGFNPWVRKIPWRRKWQPTPVFSPGKSHGQKSLVGYSLQGHKESDTIERLILSLSSLVRKQQQKTGLWVYDHTHKPMGEMCGLPSEYWTCPEVREPSRNSNTSYLNSKCTWAKTVLKKHLLQRLLHVIKHSYSREVVLGIWVKLPHWASCVMLTHYFSTVQPSTAAAGL